MKMILNMGILLSLSLKKKNKREERKRNSHL